MSARFKIGDTVRLVHSEAQYFAPRFRGPLVVEKWERYFWGESKYRYRLYRWTKSGRKEFFGRFEERLLVDSNFGKKLFKEFL